MPCHLAYSWLGPARPRDHPKNHKPPQPALHSPRYISMPNLPLAYPLPCLPLPTDTPAPLMQHHTHTVTLSDAPYLVKICRPAAEQRARCEQHRAVRRKAGCTPANPSHAWHVPVTPPTRLAHCAPTCLSTNQHTKGQAARADQQ